MKQFRVKLKKSGKSFIIKVPELVADLFRFQEGNEIIISIHNPESFTQVNLWDNSVKDIDRIDIQITGETHSMNMYNRIYVPSKFRFFFPPSGVDFILNTNVGQVKTDITQDGFMKKNMRLWLSKNGPLDPGDLLRFEEISGLKNHYRLTYIKFDSEKS